MSTINEVQRFTHETLTDTQPQSREMWGLYDMNGSLMSPHFATMCEGIMWIMANKPMMNRVHVKGRLFARRILVITIREESY